MSKQSNFSLTIGIFAQLIKDLHSPVSWDAIQEVISLGNPHLPKSEVTRLADLLQGLEPHRVLALLSFLWDKRIIL